MKLLRKRIKETISREILDAAEEVIGEQSVVSTNASMSAIAERAGISVGTLYNYFSDKDELVQLILRNRQQRFAEVLAAAVTEHSDKSFAEQLHAVLLAILQLHEQHAPFWRMIFEGKHPASPIQRSPWINFVDQLELVVDKGVAEGLLTARYKGLYAKSLAGLIFSYLIDGRREAGAATSDDLARHLVAFFLATQEQSPKR